MKIFSGKFFQLVNRMWNVGVVALECTRFSDEKSGVAETAKKTLKVFEGGSSRSTYTLRGPCLWLEPATWYDDDNVVGSRSRSLQWWAECDARRCSSQLNRSDLDRPLQHPTTLKPVVCQYTHLQCRLAMIRWRVRLLQFHSHVVATTFDPLWCWEIAASRPW